MNLINEIYYYVRLSGLPQKPEPTLSNKLIFFFGTPNLPRRAL